METMVCRKCKAEVPKGAFCLSCGAKQDVSDRSPRKRGNGTGTVFKRGKNWTAQVTKYTYTDTNGETAVKKRRYSTKGGFQTKRDAILYLESLANDKYKRVPSMIELWELYRENEFKKLSSAKQSGYNAAVKRLDSIMGRPINTLSVADLQRVVNSGSTSYYTAKDMKVVLSKLYQLAMADEFVSQNLSKHIVLPELVEKEQTPFTEDEVSKMWSCFADGDSFAGYLLLMIYSGMMPGEMLSCRKDMIDLDRCEIVGAGKKTKVRRSTPIVFADSVRPVVEELMTLSSGQKLYGKHPDDWYKEYHAFTKRAGIRDLPPYSCRHTTGTEAARLNLSAPIIQKIMRHATITMSQRYIHLASEETHDALNKFGAATNK